MKVAFRFTQISKNTKFTKKCFSFQERNTKVFEDIKDWWDLNGSMKPLHALNTFRVQCINDFVKKYKLTLNNKSSLDIGCGGGLLTESLARLNTNITGIDPNITSYEIAKRHLEVYKGSDYVNLSSRINYINCKIEDLPNKPEYDFIFAFEVIEHIENQKEFIEEISKRLKVGGCLFISTLNKNIVSKLLTIDIGEAFNLIPKGTHEYEKYISPIDLESHLQSENIRVLEKKGVFYNPICNTATEIDSLFCNYLMAGVKI